MLISAGILFCGGFAVWTFVEASRTGSPAAWALGGVFAFLALGLAVYLWNLSRFLGYRDD